MQDFERELTAEGLSFIIALKKAAAYFLWAVDLLYYLPHTHSAIT